MTMLAREISSQEKDLYNSHVRHPLQSWEWGEFRKETGLEIERVGFFQSGQLKSAFQVTFHKIPIIGGTVGYLPKGYAPDENQLSSLKQLGKKHKAVFIKLEPNVASKPDDKSPQVGKLEKFLIENGVVPGRPLFTKFTFQLDLTPSENQLFDNLQSKTRYNINLAHRKGVTIYEDSSQKGLEVYLSILQETTHRQEFYAHSPQYFRKMWDQFKLSKTMRIFHAVYQNQVLASWIIFIFEKTIYYPYGASRSIHRNVMASNLMMWEMIKFGKKENCTTFDMWGSLGPNPNPKNPWFGFHRFKKGYGGELVEFLGTYDYILNGPKYKIFTLANSLRWKLLKLKAKLKL